MLEGGASFTARAAGVMSQFWPTNEPNDIATALSFYDTKTIHIPRRWATLFRSTVGQRSAHWPARRGDKNTSATAHDPRRRIHFPRAFEDRPRWGSNP